MGSRPMDTSCCVFTSTPPHSQTGAPPMAQAPAAPDAESWSRRRNRELWPTGLTSTVLAEYRPIASPASNSAFGGACPWGFRVIAS